MLKFVLICSLPFIGIALGFIMAELVHTYQYYKENDES